MHTYISLYLYTHIDMYRNISCCFFRARHARAKRPLGGPTAAPRRDHGGRRESDSQRMVEMDIGTTFEQCGRFET